MVKILMGMLASGVGEKIGGVIGGDVGLGDGGGKNINSDGSGCGVSVIGMLMYGFGDYLKCFYIVVVSVAVSLDSV